MEKDSPSEAYPYVWVSSSIYQMTRGSVVIFSALLSVQWLGRTLRSFHLWAIAMVVVAVAAVGVAGILEASSSSSSDDNDDDDDDDGGGGDDGDDGDDDSNMNSSNDDDGASSGKVVLGLGLIVAAQFSTACQMILAERIMTRPGKTLSPVRGQT
jgi:drug/metabolite transporter (DMT)-like permease